jgi:tetratricopeptide (TPR) repeat protein
MRFLFKIVLIVAALAFAAMAGSTMPPAFATARADELDDAYRLGIAHFRAGRYQQALPYFQKALQLAEAKNGADSPAIAVELNNLGEVNRLLGHYDDAEKLYRQALVIDEKTKGPNDPALATSLNNLALVYRAQNRLTDAEKLYERSLALLERSVGANHPDVARSLNNLAMLYRAEGKADQAVPLQTRAVQIATASLGADNPTTAVLKRNLDAVRASAAAGGRTVLAATPSATRPPTKAAVPPPPTTAPVPRPPRDAPPAIAPPPRPQPTAPAEPPAAAGGGDYEIHLSSVRSADGTHEEWARLQAHYPSLQAYRLLPPQMIEIPDKGTFYRVLAGPFGSEAAAAQACAPLKAAGEYCHVIKR